MANFKIGRQDRIFLSCRPLNARLPQPILQFFSGKPVGFTGLALNCYSGKQHHFTHGKAFDFFYGKVHIQVRSHANYGFSTFVVTELQENFKIITVPRRNYFTNESFFHEQHRIFTATVNKILQHGQLESMGA